jgi:hypothetical protein
VDVKVISGGSETAMVCVAKHPFASVQFTVYIPIGTFGTVDKVLGIVGHK